ncbi:MAG: sialate O-acetylesterase [Cyclobacteriaceae bacterium]
MKYGVWGMIILCFGGCSDDIDIYILLGQSNMAGRDKISTQDTTTDSRLLVLDTAGAWVTAQPPFNIGKPSYGSGILAMSFGKKMLEQYPNSTIGLIPCAVGGSAISEWQPGAFNSLRDTYPYDEAIEKIKTGLKKGKIKGILWHLGETDSQMDRYRLYKPMFDSLLFNLAGDLSLDVKSIPVVIGEIGKFVYLKRPQSEKINQILNEIATEKVNVGIVSSEGLTDIGDSLHFTSSSQRELGERYVDQMTRLKMDIR